MRLCQVTSFCIEGLHIFKKLEGYVYQNVNGGGVIGDVYLCFCIVLICLH